MTTRRRRRQDVVKHFRLMVRLVIGIVIGLAMTVPAWSAGRQFLKGHVPPAVKKLTPLRRTDAAKKIRLAIGLPPRNPDDLTKLLHDLYDPASPQYRHYLAPAQFTEKFGPTADDYQKLIDFAKSKGLTVTTTHPNRLLLDVEAEVSVVEQVFHVQMHTFRHPTEARDFYAPDTDPSLDLPLAVLHVSGLDNYYQPHPNSKLRQALAKPAGMQPNSGSASGGAYAGNDFRAAYVPGTTLTGSGQSVGLLQFDGYYASDIAAYRTQFNLPNIPLINVPIDGGVATPGSGNSEVCLDIEMVMSMAPGVTAIYVYEAPNPSPWVDLLSRMANDNLSKQLSCSWGGGGPDASAEIIFQQMAAQGQSFFNATGDSDAFTGSISFPSDSPNITEVGATTLTTTGPGGSYVSETVWNWNNGTGSSGGVSPTYTIPVWQQGVSMLANQGSTTMRNVPDVALTGDNVYVLYNNGGTGNFGGTSCAAPLWAAFTALVNQQAASGGRASVGFLNPTLYNIGKGGAYTSNFHDTTTGNNFSSSSPTKFAAVTGFDLCTGWGTPAGTSMINTLAGPPDPLQVAPVSFVASGTYGGPFTPNSASYVLTNNGSTPINWTAAKTANWNSISADSGTLAPGDSVTVIWSLNSAANALTPGSYSDTLTFTNPNTGVSQGVGVSLVIDPPRIAYFDLNTDPGWTRQGEWAYGTPTGGGGVSFGSHDPTSGATGTKVFGINLSGDYSTTVGGPYYLTTGAINTSHYGGTQLRFKRWLDADYTPWTYQTVDVSKDGSTWTNLFTNASGSPVTDSSWTTQTYTLGAAFDNQPTIFIRWGHRVASSGAFAYCGWNIDDVEILGTPTTFVSLSLDRGTATEGEGPVTGTVTANSAPQSDLVVTLTGDNSNKATVPATVTIPAGQTSATFPITIVDNTVLDGTQAVNLTATAAGYAGATISLSVQDNETAILSLSLPASTTEGAGSVQGTVSVSAAPAGAVTVALSSSDSTAVQVPATVTIAAGQTSANFSATIVDDNKINGTHSATLTAHVANWTDGTASIAVQDNETTNLAVTLPASVTEGTSTSGSVSISGTLATDLTVTLVSSDPTRLTVPTSVTITAGSTSASFSMVAPDNALTDGTESVSITASAAGFTSGMSSTNVLDNDVDHFVISSIGASQVAGVPFSVTITAKDVNGVTMLSYVAPLTLSATGSAGVIALSPTTTGAFVNGVWTGNVTVGTLSSNVVITADDGAGHSAASNAFTTGAGPLHHFSWDPVANPQTANSAFSVTVTARDAGNNIVTNYNGSVTLSGRIPGIASPIVITEVNPNTPDEIQFMNVGSSPVDISGWKIYIYDFDTWPGPQTAFTIPAGTTCAAGQFFRLQEFGTAPGTFPQFFLGVNINWTADPTAYVAVMVTDAAGNMKDFVCVGAATPSSIISPSTIPSAQWSGATVTATTSTAQDYARIGHSDGNAASDWAISTVALGSVNPLLVTPFTGLTSPVTVTPTTSGTFVNGTWTGNMAVLQLATQMNLHADDGGGHSGDSSTFDVQAPGALVLSAPSSAAEGVGSVNGTVTLPAISAVDVTVSLASNLSARASVPATVLIPAGQISATFPITVVDDGLLNGSPQVTLTATAPLYGNATGSFTVVDNESAVLSVTMPVSVSETQGVLPSGGTVSVSAPVDSDVVVNLTSSDPASLIVPATVTITTGTTSKTFAVTVVDDSLFNGDRSVTVTAHVAGWTDGSASTLVKDDESTANWPGAGNGVAHTGYQPVTLGSATFTAGWSRLFPTSVQSIAVGNGSVFVTPFGSYADSLVSAVDAMSGAPLWRYRYATAAFSMSPPSVSAGRVFVQRGNSVSGGDAALSCFDAASGSLLWNSPIIAQAEGYFAPTSINGGVWVEGGNVGGLYGFNVVDGSQRFFNNSLEQFDLWAPAYYNGTIYTWVDGNFRAHDPNTGVIQWTLGEVFTGIVDMATSPAIDNGMAFVVGKPGFYAIDLASHMSPWNFNGGNYKGSPSVANHVVYVMTQGNVFGYDTATGSLVNSYFTGDSNINGQPILTNDTLIVASPNNTYIFDLAGTLRQTIPVGGQVSLANNVLYIASLDGTLHTYYLSGSPTADLAVSQTVSPNPAISGTNVTITVTATNNGPSTAASATVREVLPPGLTFVSAVSSQGSCTQNGSVVTATLGDLANGASATVTITATSNGASNRNIDAAVFSSTYDPNGTNNSTTTVLNFDQTPLVTTYAASGISDFSATFNATVNPNSLPTTGVFEYGTDTSYGNTVQLTYGTMNGATDIAVPMLVSGLLQGTTYHFRIKATNSAGTTVGDDMTFTTTDTRPILTTLAATNVTTTSATLNGTVNGNNQTTNVAFDYGTSTSYGSSVFALPFIIFGPLDTAVTGSLTGLTPGTTYHFRVNAANNSGTRLGNDLTFTTISTDASLLSLVPGAGTLSPAFASTSTSYAEAVPNTVSSITFTPTAAPGATVKVNGATVVSGSASAPISLAVGANTVTIAVTAQDGVTTKTYTVQVTRFSSASPFLTTGALPSGRLNAMAVLLNTGKVLVAGGSVSLNTALLYDPALGTWSSTGNMTAGRYQATATLLPNGKVLVVGGTGTGGPLQSAETYDPATGLWTAVASMHNLRREHCAVLLPNGSVMVAGGFGIATTNTVEIYDPAFNSWTVVSSMQTARAFAAGALLPDGRVLIAGGQAGSNFIKDSEIYDPGTGVWTYITNFLNVPRYSHTLTVLPNGKALATGGTAQSGTTSAAELFDPATGIWTATTNMTMPRQSHAASLLPSGKLLVTGGNSNTAETYDYATGTWTSAGIMTATYQQHTSTLLPNGRVLIAAGGTTATTLYDSAQGWWAPTVAPMAAARVNAVTKLLPNGKVLVASGYNGTWIAGCEIFDPGAGTWSSTDPVVNQRAAATGFLLPNGKVLVTGGYNGVYLSSTEIYDYTSGRWTAGGNLNTARSVHAGALLPSGKVLVAGGYNGSSYFTSTELYNPATNAWTPTGSMAFARSSFTATTLVSGKVLVAGGFGTTGYPAPAELYDPATGKWTTVGSIAIARNLHTATLLFNGKVLVAGGYNGVVTNSCQLFDPATNLWSATGGLLTARDHHLATLLPNGKVLVTGGWSGSTYLATSELYDPEKGTWTATAGPMLTPRQDPIGTLLPNGKVLVLAGTSVSGVYTAASETFDPGLAYSTATQPQITTATSPLNYNAELLVTGLRFKGISGASGGGYQDSSTNYPLMQLRSLETGQTQYLLSSTSNGQGWTNASYHAKALTGFMVGHALLTPVVNGTPGVSSIINVGAPPQPVPVTLAATHVDATTALLNGTVNANGIAATVTFNWGTTTSYGTTVTATPSTVSSSSAVPVTASLTGLTPATTYHCRVNGANSFGLVNGSDMTFTTPSNDASLTSLTLSDGALSPGFGSGTLSYTSAVPHSVDFVNVTPTASNANATIQVQVNGDPAISVASGSPSAPLTLFTGKNTIYVNVTAQDGTTSTSYQINLMRATDFASWAVAKGLSGPNNGPAQDYDNDGVPNLLEYAFGTDPTVAASGTLAVNGSTLSARGGPVTLSVTNGTGGTDRYAMFMRRDDYAFAGLIYTVEFSPDLRNWVASPATPAVVADDGEMQAVTIPYMDLIGGQPVRFFRVKVSAP